MRVLTTDFEAELSAAVVRPFLMAELRFASGTLRMWTGVGELEYAGETWFGGGNFIGITPIKESQSFEANGITVSLNGIPSENVALALTERPNRRPMIISLGFFDENGAVIDSPVVLARYRMDTMPIQEGADKSNIGITGESIAAILKGASNRRWTQEDQWIDFPDDRGFQFVDSLQNKDIKWKPQS